MSWFSKRDKAKVRDFDDVLYIGKLKHIFGEMIRKGQAA